MISPPSPEAASRRVARELKSRAGQPAAPAPGLSYLDLACFTHYRHPTPPRHRDTRDAPGAGRAGLTAHASPRRCGLGGRITSTAAHTGLLIISDTHSMYHTTQT
jgi:hypothetical protein